MDRKERGLLLKVDRLTITRHDSSLTVREELQKYKKHENLKYIHAKFWTTNIIGSNRPASLNSP